MESFGRTSIKNKLTNSSQSKYTGEERTKRGELVTVLVTLPSILYAINKKN